MMTKWLKFALALFVVISVLAGAYFVFGDTLVASWRMFTGLLVLLVFLSAIYSSAETSLGLLQEREAQAVGQPAGTVGPITQWRQQVASQYTVSRNPWHFVYSNVLTALMCLISKDRFRITLAVVLIMNNAVNLGFTVLIGWSLIPEPHPVKEWFQIAWTMLPVLVLGEILAKASARKFPRFVAIATVFFVWPWTFCFPIGWFADGLTGPFPDD